MLAHGLAIALWVGSLALYGAAFFFPEVHRRHDFFWSGVAAFYGLVLWFDAGQISSTELLGHGASLALLGWFGWQTLSLRRKRTPLDLQTPLTAESWPTFWGNLRQSLLGLAQATPLGRWLPEAWEKPKAVDPAIAVSEIRVSSLKDVDYEFVDELAPVGGAKAVAAELSSVPTRRSSATTAQPPRPTTPPSADAPAAMAKSTGPSLGARVAGLRTWFSDGLKARRSPSIQREVIEIPPRPSPLDRKKPKRDVIDIPPRPSPLDRYKNKPAEENASPPETVPPETVTIVDTAAVESSGDWDGPMAEPFSAPVSETVSNDISEALNTPEAETIEGNIEVSGSPETTSDDDNTNWIDD